MNIKNLICIAIGVIALQGLSVNLQNGNISAEVNGDGNVGALTYQGLNHVADGSIRLRHSSGTFTTKHIVATEALYNNFQMMTGYGRQANSNMYVVTTSRIYGTNTCVDQTMVVVSRVEVPLGISYYLDANVRETTESDVGGYNTANQTLTQSEGDSFIGIMAKRNLIAPDSYYIDNLANVRNAIMSSTLPNTIIGYSPVDMAAAVAWNNVSLVSQSAILKTRLMASDSDFGIQSQSNLSSPPVYTLGKSDFRIDKAKFVQKFNKLNRDSLKLKGEIDVSSYYAEFANMAGFHFSMYIGDYLVFQAGDGSETKVTTNKRKHKIDTIRGKCAATLVYKKGALRFNIKLSKTDIKPATMVSSKTPNGLKQPMLLPVTIILTGYNPNDDIKAGKVWIITDSLKVLLDKKNENIAKAKN